MATAKSHSHILRITGPGADRTKTITVTGSGSQSLDEDIANGQTNKRIEFTLDVSALKSIWICSDQDVTLETNDGTTPADTIALQAGVPYMWHSDSYDACLLTTDITALFITNASGASANLTIEALTDVTP